jgi:hypothetical protein
MSGDINVQTFSGKVNINNNLLVGSSHLFVDTANNRVGITTASPGASLEVNGNVHVATDVTFGGTLTGDGSGLANVNSDSGLWTGAGTGNVYLSTSTDNVGIGTSSPTELLHIKDGSIRLDSIGTVSIINKHDTSDYGTLELSSGYQGGQLRPKISIVGDTGQGSAHLDGVIKFHTNGDQRMVVRSDGFVGIGVDNPSSYLEVRGTNSSHNTTIYPLIVSTASSSTTEVEEGIGTGIEFKVQRRNSDVQGNCGNIQVYGAAGIPSTSDYWNMAFRVRDNDTLRDVMTLKYNGYVGIGKDPSALLDVNGSIRGAYNSNTTSYFGRTAIGYAGYNDYASFSHVDRSTTGNYALLQSSGGFTFLNCTSGQGIAFRINNSDKMRMNSSGYLGIGTTSPGAPLHVNAAAGSISSSDRRYLNTKNFYTNTGTWGNMSIYAIDDIVTREYLVCHRGTISSSDRRIKKDIVDIDDAYALDTLRLLKPKRYSYKDVVSRGEEAVLGFIAQEVREVLPSATQLRTDFIPNIYEVCNVTQSNVITFTDFTTTNLNSQTSKIKLLDDAGVEKEANIVEVIDDHNIRVDEDLTDMTGVVEGETGDKIFVYGEEVDDFVHIRKEAIFTIATAAVQEVDRQQQADKMRIVELETQIQTEKERTQQIEADLQTTRTELEQALEAEKVKTKNLESRLAFLETAVASLIS